MALAQGLIHELQGRDLETEWMCLVPNGFKSLVFRSDHVLEYPAELMKFGNYNEVAEFTDVKWSRLRRFLSDSRRSIGASVLESFQGNHFARMIGSGLVSSPRGLKFFWMNLRLHKWINNVRRELSMSYDTVTFWPVNDLMLLGEQGIEYRNVSLSQSFVERFRVLDKAIRNGLTFRPEASPVPEVADAFKSPDVLVRSRNYSQKQLEHNSNAAALTQIVEEKLAEGLVVVQSGHPVVPLSIRHESYLEVSHLSLDSEMALLSEGKTVVFTEGGAGLFTLMACLVNEIRVTSSEWSVESLDPQISLLDARKKRAS